MTAVGPNPSPAGVNTAEVRGDGRILPGVPTSSYQFTRRDDRNIAELRTDTNSNCHPGAKIRAATGSAALSRAVRIVLDESATNSGHERLRTV
jgi:hypothetical protein